MIQFKTLSAQGAALVLAGLAMLAPAPAMAETSVVVDVATGKVLSQNEAGARWYPASTTKLMTAYIALRQMRAGEAALDTPVVMTRLAASAAPSKMWYEPGSVIRLDNALRMILVKSANDVAVAIAETLGGSHDAFVAQMNAEARRLGMNDTRFINPNGLPGEGQYSSARDLALLGAAIRREFPAFTEFFGAEAITTGTDVMRTGNDLIGRFPGADGMKTGYICASGFNVVASATREGRTLVAVVLGADGPISRARTAAELLEEGFSTDPAGIELSLADIPGSSGAPADISQEICSAAGRTARANERAAEAGREQTFGSPYLSELGRPRVAVPVGLGGAAGTDTVEPGVSVIAAYNYPVPTPRPAFERPAAPSSPQEAAGPEEADAGEPESVARTALRGAVEADGDGDGDGEGEADGGQ